MFRLNSQAQFLVLLQTLYLTQNMLNFDNAVLFGNSTFLGRMIISIQIAQYVTLYLKSRSERKADAIIGLRWQIQKV